MDCALSTIIALFARESRTSKLTSDAEGGAACDGGVDELRPERQIRREDEQGVEYKGPTSTATNIFNLSYQVPTVETIRVAVISAQNWKFFAQIQFKLQLPQFCCCHSSQVLPNGLQRTKSSHGILLPFR
jgi:hypothetical protein